MNVKLPALLLCIVVVVGVGCSTDDRLATARTELRDALVVAQCDHRDTITYRPAVQAACNNARYACYDGPTADTVATADRCEAAVRELERSVGDDSSVAGGE